MTSKGKSSKANQWSEWSEWGYDVEKNCQARYRRNAQGEYEYDYGNRGQGQGQGTSSGVTPRTTPAQQAQIPQSSAPYSYTQSYTLDRITEDVAQMDLSPSTQAYAHQAQAASSGPQEILTRETRKTEKLFQEYKHHKSKDFTWGRMFKVLWAEPKGGGDEKENLATEHSVRHGKHGEKHYEKVRRFLIIDDKKKGHSICLPINTYTAQGVMKHGVHAEDHTVVYTGEREPPLFKGEYEKGLVKTPIRISISDQRHKLDPASRLNYAKLYTVEHNVKVCFVGKIHKEFERIVERDYNKVHPPISRAQLPADSSQDPYQLAKTTSYDDQSDPRYNASYNPSSGSAQGQYSETYGYEGQSYPMTGSGYQQAQPTVATTSYGNIQTSQNVASYYPSGSGESAYADGAPGPAYSQYPQYGSGSQGQTYSGYDSVSQGQQYNPQVFQQQYSPDQHQHQQQRQEPEEIYSDEEYDRHGKKKRHRKYRK